LLWREETAANGKPTKVPYQRGGRYHASATSSRTWCTFDQARHAFERGGFDGIGFALTDDDPFVGLDLDHVLDMTTGEIAGWAHALITQLDSYTERTPGGDGLRVWITADAHIELPTHRCTVAPGQNLEVYRTDRYYTVTGAVWHETTSIAERSDGLRAIIAQYLTPAPRQTSTPPTRSTSVSVAMDTTDAEVLTRIRRSANAANFQRLWDGALDANEGMNGGDLALCNYLAFYCGGPDPARIDRIFRTAPRFREDKWDRRHYASGETYGQRTIACALEGRTAYYSPERREMPDPAPHATAGDVAPDTGRPCTSVMLPDPDDPTPDDEQPVVPDPGDSVTNYRVGWIEDKDGNSKPVNYALQPDEITRAIHQLSHGWPRVCDGTLFTPNVDGTRPQWFLQTPEVQAWLASLSPIAWRKGLDYVGNNFTSMEVMHAYLRQHCEAYQAIEAVPHTPPLPEHYYFWRPDPSYTPNGRYFDALLSRFDNHDTEYDRLLIRAMFLTPGWGCTVHGRRPVFAITAPDSGCGKTTLADMVGRLYGGTIESITLGGASTTAREVNDFITRLLSPEARQQRVVRADNVRGEVRNGSVESLITTPVISGRQLFKGEGKRPNTLTWIITANGLRLAHDMAQRTFFINLTRPSRANPRWEDETIAYMEQHRCRIHMDIAHILSQPPPVVEHNERWGKWVNEVLARCTTAVYPLLGYNDDRREHHNTDAEEATLVYDAIASLSDMRSEYYQTGWRFATRHVVVAAVNEALGVHMTTRAALALVRQHIESKRLSDKLTEHVRTSSGIRGFIYKTREPEEETDGRE
jgi:putative DNA primase/helicase